ncbi:MAG: DUF3473 domain-containing protein [Desulfatiglans sp.]|jgi:polysaccharide deacetylase family protein (PEP-CTERM system associated)|nr:DUF3473 domain-containing protein [Desulfatiglans sp.]
MLDFNKRMTHSKLNILITVDLEDWFQVENFKQYIPFSSWSERKLRVEKNAHMLLDLFDSSETSGKIEISRLNYADINSNQHPVINNDHQASFIKPSVSNKIRATFFILGWIADRLPQLVQEIERRGHEVASHGYRHDLCTSQTKLDLQNDLIKSKHILEDLTGKAVLGYRAPSFVINQDMLKIIQGCGFLYDSSYNSFTLHDRYGHIDIPKDQNKRLAFELIDNFYEIPVSNLIVANQVLPWGGGGYFRLIPFFIYSLGVKLNLKKNDGFVFYIHPWELDPEQPRVKEAAPFLRFRHYTNLKKTETKLKKFINAFNECNFITCQQYIHYNSKQ